MIAPVPASHAFLAGEPGSRMLVEALRLHGVRETAGPKSTPEIMDWADENGLRRAYTADSIPWFGLYAAVVAKRAGWPLPPRPLWARDWLLWGQAADRPMLGDVVVFSRDGGGHVGLYVGERPNGDVWVLGGNQGDAVNIKPFPRARLLGARCPVWRAVELGASHRAVLERLARRARDALRQAVEASAT